MGLQRLETNLRLNRLGPGGGRYPFPSLFQRRGRFFSLDWILDRVEWEPRRGRRTGAEFVKPTEAVAGDCASRRQCLCSVPAVAQMVSHHFSMTLCERSGEGPSPFF